MESYDVDTGLIPGGATIVVSGQHSDDGGTILCTGNVTLTLAGSPFSSPITIASGVGAAVLLFLGLMLALRGVAVGRPLGVAGTALFGLFSALLLGLGLFGSELALLLALVGLLVGGAAAMMSRKSDSTLVSGRPLPGWLFGLVGGLLLGVFGWAVGLYPLNSPLLFFVPFALSVLGFGAGLWGPLGNVAAD